VWRKWAIYLLYESGTASRRLLFEREQRRHAMNDPIPATREAEEAERSGEKPDLGRTPDALIDALSGSGVGSDTRAGSLQGGAASGSDDDPDQALVDQAMAEQGHAGVDPQSASGTDADPVVDAGTAPGKGAQDPNEGRRDDRAGVGTG